MPQSKYIGSERRNFIRIPFWFVTNYKVYTGNAQSPGIFHQGIGRNISAGGICFEAEDVFETGTSLQVEIDMPAIEHAVSIIGRVAWAKPQKGSKKAVYGLAFSMIDPEDAAMVQRIVDTFK